VLVNNGNGSFNAKRDYRTPRVPVSVAIGDLNGDRKPDLAVANNGSDAISVLLNATGLCVVPDVRRKPLSFAKRTIGRAQCRVGKIRRAYSKIAKGRVISETPKPGTVLPRGGKVKLVVSRGGRH
jgi:hypothetical protein